MDQIRQDWRAEISCRVDEVGGSFSVFIFLGHVPANPAAWMQDAGFVGTFDIFAPNSSPYASASGPFVDGFVLLNRAMLRLSHLPSLEDDFEVVKYLVPNINWGVRKVGGEIVRLETIPSLQVTIQRTPIITPIGGNPYEGLPVYFHGVTRGRPGGYHGR